MKRADWLADVLRDAGLNVKEYPGWQGRGRDFDNLHSLVWHHDASPPGDSPGVPSYMLREMAAGRAGAQVWIDRRGVWHVLAAGVAYHAGKVLPGMPHNSTSLGFETDHTVGEDWPQALLDSLRTGTAAILTRLGRDASSLHFHKSICDPVGRKSDPAGLDLTGERTRVQRLLTAPSPTRQDDVMASLEEVRAVVRDEINRLAGGPRVRGKDGQVVDSDPVTISVADVLTRVEASEARLLAAIQAKQ